VNTDGSSGLRLVHGELVSTTGGQASNLQFVLARVISLAWLREDAQIVGFAAAWLLEPLSQTKRPSSPRADSEAKAAGFKKQVLSSNFARLAILWHGTP
jgi:hypothetical protein